jgi:hypothetical protein
MSLRQCSSLVGVIDRELSTKRMKIGKAPALLKKAVSMCKSKTSVLAARLLVLASFRRKVVMASVISNKIQSLMMAADRVMVRVDSCHKALVLRKAEKSLAIYGCEIVDDLSHQFKLFDQEENSDGSCPDWTLHPIFNGDDNCSYTEEYEGDDDELSAMYVISSNRDVERLEFNFNIEDDIDQAAEIFISRFREQMNKSF